MWSYKLFNDRGLSIRVDLYRHGKYAYISSKPLSVNPVVLRNWMDAFMEVLELV